MNTMLALEQSTDVSSAAVMRGNALLSERSWTEAGTRHQKLFVTLPDLLKEASVSADAIDRFAVGLGPGVFSGLRISLSTARALALPGRRPVYGVSSGEALAWDAFRKTGSPFITVVGDARRRRFWYARFHLVDRTVAQLAPYSLIPADELASVLDRDVLVVTPHWDRIGKELLKHKHKATLLESTLAPTARTVAERVLDRLARNQPTDALQPIYMHPPVFVEPRVPQPPVSIPGPSYSPNTVSKSTVMRGLTA